MRLTRRSLLAGSAALLAACSGKKHPKAKPTPPADQALMTAAYQSEQGLIASYQAALTSATPKVQARLEVELAVHQTHLSALRPFGPKYSTSINKLPVTSTDLRHAVHTAAVAGRQAAVNATDGDHAALLASIAASHAISAATPVEAGSQ